MFYSRTQQVSSKLPLESGPPLVLLPTFHLQLVRSKCFLLFFPSGIAVDLRSGCWLGNLANVFLPSIIAVDLGLDVWLYKLALPQPICNSLPLTFCLFYSRTTKFLPNKLRPAVPTPHFFHRRKQSLFTGKKMGVV